jgi:hypothetical protein
MWHYWRQREGDWKFDGDDDQHRGYGGDRLNATAQVKQGERQYRGGQPA